MGTSTRRRSSSRRSRACPTTHRASRRAIPRSCKELRRPDLRAEEGRAAPRREDLRRLLEVRGHGAPDADEDDEPPLPEGRRVQQAEEDALELGTKEQIDIANSYVEFTAR